MSKYIIDTEAWSNLFKAQKVGIYGIGNDIATDEKTVWSRMFRLDELEELNSDYINEHYGELQDEAYQRGHDDGYEAGCATAFKPVSDAEYQRGFEDGKESKEKGCDGCKYEWCGDTEDPCWHCRKSYKDKYEPAPHSDRIEVGDEVIYNGTTKCLVIVPETDKRYASLLDCKGIHYSADHRECKKTGKHYDIASILEAMRT